jgi:hypothetical protein
MGVFMPWSICFCLGRSNEEKLPTLWVLRDTIEESLAVVSRWPREHRDGDLAPHMKQFGHASTYIVLNDRHTRRWSKRPSVIYVQQGRNTSRCCRVEPRLQLRAAPKNRQPRPRSTGDDMGYMKRAEAREEERRLRYQRFASTAGEVSVDLEALENAQSSNGAPKEQSQMVPVRIPLLNGYGVSISWRARWYGWYEMRTGPLNGTSMSSTRYREAEISRADTSNMETTIRFCGAR